MQLTRRSVHLDERARAAAHRCTAWHGRHASDSSVMRRAIVHYSEHLDALEANRDAAAGERLRFFEYIAPLLRKRAKPLMAEEGDTHGCH